MRKRISTKKNQKSTEGIVITDDTGSVSKSKREELKALSKNLKRLVAEGKFKTINEALIASYTNNLHTEFKTFDQWKGEGFSVKKGEKAFAIWSKPVTKKAEADGTDYEYFPMRFLYSNAQVQPMPK